MVSIEKAKLYCCEDISLIENYEMASKDLLETWDIHHRMENEGYSRKELIDLGMYYGRPASELIFLTKSEHMSLHIPWNKGKKGSQTAWNKGKHLSEETRKKLSEAKKGCVPWNKGKNRPEITGEKHPRSKQIVQIDKQTGEIIKTWPCAMEVQRVLGIGYRHIYDCCRGMRKSCGGYIWKYADI